MPQSKPYTRKVYALGETVLDMVSDNGFTFRAVPGGSVLNASVSLGRMGVEVQLLSEFGADKAGNVIDDFLHSNSVRTDFCTRYPYNKTSLALAFLDESRNASYSFYHDSPNEIDLLNLPDLHTADILLFGSFYAVKPNRRNVLLHFLQRAVQSKCIIYYDLNIRKAHSDQLEELMPVFMNNVAVSTIVKGSDEDFMNLFGLTDPEAIYKKVSPYCKILIITNGSRPVQVFMPKLRRSYEVPGIKPVSTIGAGDNFNAGFIYGIATSGIDSVNIAEIAAADLDRMVACGLAFAAETCLSEENYIPGNFDPDFWKRYI